MNNTRFQLKELYSNENWDSNKIDENFIISYKIFPETNTVSIRRRVAFNQLVLPAVQLRQ